MSKHEGICQICGNEGQLTFEHVPPEAAFNNRRVITLRFRETITLGPDSEIRGPINQRGAGDYTLCSKCNNLTGHWYGKGFVNWCYEGMEYLMKTGAKPSLYYPYLIFPLRVIKQIVTMFFSESPSLRLHSEELVRFVLNRDIKYLPPKYKIWVYYNLSDRARHSGPSGILNTATGKSIFFSEISFPPFGYVLTIDSDPPDERLIDISYFSHYDYSEFTDIWLKLPILPVYLALPGDYREKDQIYRDKRANDI
jgi:hypothetical protein